jgi:hypothetical protein
MRRTSVPALLMTLAVLAPAPADALCGAGTEPADPARVGPGPAGFGALPEVCPRSEIGLQGDATLLDAASVETSAVELGASALGVHVSLPVTKRARLAPFARALVPTETVYRNATRYGFDHGFTFEQRVHRKLDVIGGASFPLLLVDGSGTVHPSFQPLVRAEGAYSPFRWFTLNAGFSLRFRAGDEVAFESFEPLLGLRFFPHRRVRIDLAGRLPLAGHDRTDVGTALGASYRFDAR